ncbi:MAG: hypothetical protein HY288_16060 [Planctomycetia bacterium]|nr:hypothetical protein [Planctomycetia bacterium]
MGRIVWRALVLTFALSAAVWADERKGDYEVHDLSLWIVEPTLPMANLRANYPSAFPAVVSSSRGPQPADGTRRIAPFGMITFYGQPTENLDVDLRTIAGNFLAHWPAGESLPNRLRWTGAPRLDLVNKVEDESDFAFVDEDHWFRKAREGQALFVRRGARAERFLAYDAELGLQVPLQVLGGPDKYTLVYTAGYTSGAPLHDVLIARSTPQGRRVAWIDVLSKTDMTKTATPSNPGKPATGLFGDRGTAKPGANAGKEAPAKEAPKGSAEVKSAPAAVPAAGFEVTLSAPLSAESPEAAALTTKALSERLQRAGLTAHEAELFVAHYEHALFDGEALVVLCRLDPGVIEEKIRLSIFPEPVKTVRVAMVLMRNVDPQFGSEIERLVTELGHAKYSVRERAQKRLMELGPLAFGPLYKALTNSDLEIVLRAERILLNQNQSLTAQPQAVQADNGVFVPAVRAAPAAVAR